MNAWEVGGILVATGGGLIGGALLAWGEATRRAEASAKKRYEEQLELHKRALSQAHIGRVNRIVESPTGLEANLSIGFDNKGGISAAEVYQHTKAQLDETYCYDSQGNKNPDVIEQERLRATENAKVAMEQELKAEVDAVVLQGEGTEPELFEGKQIPDYVGTAARYADPGTFVNGPKILSMEYIEAEDYEDEENGFAKEQINIFMGVEDPIFVMDGEQITNWEELIGEHILVDFYQKVPPGTEDRVLYLRNHRRNEDYEIWQTLP